MAPLVVHIIDSPEPRAGCIHSHVAGLTSALSVEGFDTRLAALEPSGVASGWTGNGGVTGAWRRWEAGEIQQCLANAALVHVHGVAALEHPVLHTALTRRPTPLVVAPYA